MHLLVIAEEHIASPPLAALSASSEFKTVRKPSLAAARALIETGVFDACLLVVDRPDPAARETIAGFRALAPGCPLVLAPRHGAPDDELAAYEAGADVVLVPPADHVAFRAVLRRLAQRTAGGGPGAAAGPLPPSARSAAPGTAAALEVLRDFSRVFSYSLDYEQFTREFVLKLREIIGAARVVIFLEPPPTGTPGGSAPAAPASLACVGAVGVPAELIACFELSRDAGLGRRVLQSGRILRLDADSAAPFLAADPRLRREFEILGCEVALPVNDRERTIGVALLGGRITGAPFTDAELLLVYHLMEELGLAVKNSWLHRQLADNHRLFSDVLEAMTAGALVVGPDLTVLYANQALRHYLQQAGTPAPRIEFADLPAPLAASLREVVAEGQDTAPFLYEHAGPPAQVFRASLIPFPGPDRRPPQPALLLLEDFTQVRSAQRAEIEASNLKLIGLIARRFAHEIRNSLVPLTTHQQLFDTDYANTEFRDSLKLALGRETSRIQRFTEQMLFLAQTESGATDIQPLEDLLRNSFARSRDFLGRESAVLELRSEVANPVVRCHRPSLAHALQEIFLNGLQSAGDPPKVSVAVAAETMPDGRPGVTVRIHDSGRGFAPEVAPRATDPFFTTRNTGVGLGLTVAKRVIEAHAGRLELHPRGQPDDPDLVIHLPLNL